MRKRRFIQYGIYTGTALLMFAAGVFGQKVFQTAETKEIIRKLSDCFLLPGALLTGVGAMTGIASEGTFDMLSYGFYWFFWGMTHPGKSPESFYEYKMQKAEGRKGWPVPMLVVGLVFLAVSIVLAVVFMTM